MFDLALGTLTEANGELFAMDNTKKEMLYNLGLIHEKMEEKLELIEEKVISIQSERKSAGSSMIIKEYIDDMYNNLVQIEANEKQS